MFVAIFFFSCSSSSSVFFLLSFIILFRFTPFASVSSFSLSLLFHHVFPFFMYVSFHSLYYFPFFFCFSYFFLYNPIPFSSFLHFHFSSFPLFTPLLSLFLLPLHLFSSPYRHNYLLSYFSSLASVSLIRVLSVLLPSLSIYSFSSIIFFLLLSPSFSLISLILLSSSVSLLSHFYPFLFHSFLFIVPILLLSSSSIVYSHFIPIPAFIIHLSCFLSIQFYSIPFFSSSFFSPSIPSPSFTLISFLLPHSHSLQRAFLSLSLLFTCHLRAQLSSLHLSFRSTHTPNTGRGASLMTGTWGP